MAIKGLTDKVVRVPRVGVFKIGEKVQQGTKTYSRSLDHFKFPEPFDGLLPAKPSTIEILLPFNSIEECFPTHLTRYKGGTIICRGDGETADVYNPETRDYTKGKCKYKDCPDYVADKCKELGRLNVLIPSLPGLGVWQITTSSYYSITGLIAEMEEIWRLFGRLTGIPLQLAVETQKSASNRSIHVLHLRSSVPLGELKEQLQKESLAQMVGQEPGDSHVVDGSDEFPAELFPDKPADFEPVEPANDEQCTKEQRNAIRKIVRDSGKGWDFLLGILKGKFKAQVLEDLYYGQAKAVIAHLETLLAPQEEQAPAEPETVEAPAQQDSPEQPASEEQQADAEEAGIEQCPLSAKTDKASDGMLLSLSMLFEQKGYKTKVSRVRWLKERGCPAPEKLLQEQSLWVQDQLSTLENANPDKPTAQEGKDLLEDVKEIFGGVVEAGQQSMEAGGD